MSKESPSPFTVPAPVFKPIDPDKIEPLFTPYTVCALITNLTGFAEFWEIATKAIETAEHGEKQMHSAHRDVHIGFLRDQFAIAPGIDRVRAYCLSHYGEELTLLTARRLLGELIRDCGLSLADAELLTLIEAMDRLESSPNTTPAPAKFTFTEIRATASQSGCALSEADTVTLLSQYIADQFRDGNLFVFYMKLRAVVINAGCSDAGKANELTDKAMNELYRRGAVEPFFDPSRRARWPVDWRILPAAVASGEKPTAAAATQASEGEMPSAGPDGLLDADGFRFAGMSVRFGRAAKQLALVRALWDTKRKRPTEPRPVQDVINEVWGEDNDTEDTAFRKMCCEVRTKFETANCPLAIVVMNGMVQLKYLKS